jgi:hypothetical protein
MCDKNFIESIRNFNHGVKGAFQREELDPNEISCARIRSHRRNGGANCRKYDDTHRGLFGTSCDKRVQILADLFFSPHLLLPHPRAIRFGSFWIVSKCFCARIFRIARHFVMNCNKIYEVKQQ